MSHSVTVFFYIDVVVNCKFIPHLLYNFWSFFLHLSRLFIIDIYIIFFYCNIKSCKFWLLWTSVWPFSVHFGYVFVLLSTFLIMSGDIIVIFLYRFEWFLDKFVFFNSHMVAHSEFLTKVKLPCRILLYHPESSEKEHSILLNWSLLRNDVGDSLS